MINLRPNNITVEFNDKTYKLNWLKQWRKPYVVLGTSIVHGFDTLGEPGNILFARHEGNKITILCTWGRGKLYELYVYDHKEKFT